MNSADYLAACRAHIAGWCITDFADMWIEEADLRRVRANERDIFFACPLGGEHCAMRARGGDVLHCYHCDAVWLVRPIDVCAVIENEESAYSGLLDKFRDMPSSLSPEDAFRLRTQQGAPLEMVEARCTDAAKLHVLLDASKRREARAIFG